MMKISSISFAYLPFTAAFVPPIALVQCESIINTLQEQLTSKDEQIASLEEKIVQMSFELASSKAFEYEHRSKSRVSNVDDDGNEDDE